MHMMNKVDLTLEEQETITVSNKLTAVISATETIRTTAEQATAYVEDLDMFVSVQLFEDTLVSSGKTLRTKWVII